jgi:NADPH:quinone reductase
MLAAWYATDLGDGGALHVGELERPEPGPGEVRVRMQVSGVNPTDWKARERPVGGSAGSIQVPHHDGVGVIDAVGEGVDEWRMGDRVWTWFAAWENQWGTAAQWSVVPDERAVALPDVASDELGAGLGIPALTAHQCLFDDGPVEGLDVLVAGGAGAVGHAAIELARWGGARRVVATASTPEKASLARRAGADLVVNYRDEGAAAQIREAVPDGIHRVVEVALGANAALDIEVCARGAVISTYASEAEDPVLPVRRLMVANMQLEFVLCYVMPRKALAAAVGDVAAAVGAGALTSLPATRFPLERIAEAHDAVRGGAVGKVLVEVP